jgi:hypothetical protein
MGSTRQIATRLAVAVGLSLVAGCFQTTPYQPDGLGGGYSDSHVDSSTMLVSFRSNHRTPRRTLELYMLYRCAQVVRDAGYDYFVLVNPATGTADMTAGAGLMALASNDSIATRTVYFPDNTLSFDHDGAHARIKMFHGKTPANVPASYDTAEVITDLTPAIRGQVSMAEQSAPQQSVDAARVYRGAVKDYLADEP